MKRTCEIIVFIPCVVGLIILANNNDPSELSRATAIVRCLLGLAAAAYIAFFVSRLWPRED